MSDSDSLFDWVDGSAWFRGLPVQWLTLTLASHTFRLAALADAADLLDQPDFARSFLEDDMAPYGMELWPAAPMLAEHILHAEDGADRRAIEIGCGLGLVAMAAASKGWRVRATDYDSLSLRFAKHNAALNAVDTVEFTRLDWHAPFDGERFDRVFGADVLYQRTDHVPILTCVARLLGTNGVACLADPNRMVADHFADLARGHGFHVAVIPTSGVNARGRRVEGRIFALRRAGSA